MSSLTRLVPLLYFSPCLVFNSFKGQPFSHDKSNSELIISTRVSESDHHAKISLDGWLAFRIKMRTSFASFTIKHLFAEFDGIVRIFSEFKSFRNSGTLSNGEIVNFRSVGAS